MNDFVVIPYSGQQVSVPKEVADFLEQDRKREQAQEKQDKRHLSKSEFETVLSGSDCVRRPMEDEVLWNLQLETLRKAVQKLDAQEQNLVALRYGQELTMEEIIKLMVGRELTNRFPPKTNKPGEVALEVEHLSARYSLLQDVSFKARKGEIVGLAGLDGSGL